ncbi:hypothetical protein ACH4ZX_03605 [Streptomyces sp. NPDC020490]|uniref:hypothetical protein n=1 Tax=Streptomyces sp. NPDC020490 TaxID=3365078 RepID=UPI0037A43659
MSAELVKHTAPAASLPDMVRYANELANANLLPGQYRRQPANVLYAMEYGRTLGITPLAAITGIHVIEGKPSASAALISGLVRQAGHKLRVRVENGPGGPRAIATIHRADDPEFEFRAEWDMDRARGAGLVNKDVWRKYPQAMLKARAITEVARDACEEVLFGLHYTPEELDANVSEDGVPVDASVQQLRRVQPGEGDPWATPGPQQGTPPEQEFADTAAKATDQTAVKDVYRQAHAAGLLAATVKVDGESTELGAYLIARGQQLAAPAPTTGDDASDDGVVDAEVVETPAEPTADPVADAQAAERELRDAAARVGLDNLDEEFERSYGLPISEASARDLRGMTAILTGHAA